MRETVPDADAPVELLTPLGFGHANVVVAVPQAWIDVRTMADLDEVAADMRARHGRRLRVATKYVNLTRRFFARDGRRRLPHRREPRRHRGRAGRRARPSSSSTSPRPARRSRPTRSRCSTTASSCARRPTSSPRSARRWGGRPRAALARRCSPGSPPRSGPARPARSARRCREPGDDLAAIAEPLRGRAPYGAPRGPEGSACCAAPRRRLRARRRPRRGRRPRRHGARRRLRLRGAEPAAGRPPRGARLAGRPAFGRPAFG